MKNNWLIEFWIRLLLSEEIDGAILKDGGPAFCEMWNFNWGIDFINRNELYWLFKRISIDFVIDLAGGIWAGKKGRSWSWTGWRFFFRLMLKCGENMLTLKLVWIDCVLWDSEKQIQQFENYKHFSHFHHFTGKYRGNMMKNATFWDHVQSIPFFKIWKNTSTWKIWKF